MYDKLVAKVDKSDTCGFVAKTKYNTDKSDVENKISGANKKNPDISGLVKKTDFNAKITEIVSKIPSISSLATSGALYAVENKIPDVNSLVKKKDYDGKISDIENKYITSADYNKFTKDIVDNIIKSIHLVDKFAIAGFINNANLDLKKVATLATKVELKAKKDKIITLQAFDSSYFQGKNHFEDDGTQNYLIFQSMYRANMYYVQSMVILSILQNKYLKHCLITLNLLLCLIIALLQY